MLFEKQGRFNFLMVSSSAQEEVPSLRRYDFIPPLRLYPAATSSSRGCGSYGVASQHLPLPLFFSPFPPARIQLVPDARTAVDGPCYALPSFVSFRIFRGHLTRLSRCASPHPAKLALHVSYHVPRPDLRTTGASMRSAHSLHPVESH